jgi:hypothetical protein
MNGYRLYDYFFPAGYSTYSFAADVSPPGFVCGVDPALICNTTS